MNKNEKNRFLSDVTNSANDEKSSEKLIIIVFSVIANRNKKVEIFKRPLKNFKTMKTMNLLTH